MVYMERLGMYHNQTSLGTCSSSHIVRWSLLGGRCTSANDPRTNDAMLRSHRRSLLLGLRELELAPAVGGSAGRRLKTTPAEKARARREVTPDL